MTTKKSIQILRDAEEYLRSTYGAYRGHHAWRDLEDAFNAGKAAMAEPQTAAPSETIDSPEFWGMVNSWSLMRRNDGKSDVELVAFIDAWGARLVCENAPWLTLAHTICADMGIANGHITDRLQALRDQLSQDWCPECHARDTSIHSPEINASPERVDAVKQTDWSAS